MLLILLQILRNLGILLAFCGPTILNPKPRWCLPPSRRITLAALDPTKMTSNPDAASNITTAYHGVFAPEALT